MYIVCTVNALHDGNDMSCHAPLTGTTIFPVINQFDGRQKNFFSLSLLGPSFEPSNFKTDSSRTQLLIERESEGTKGEVLEISVFFLNLIFGKNGARVNSIKSTCSRLCGLSKYKRISRRKVASIFL